MWITISIVGILVLTLLLSAVAKNKNKLKFKLYQDFTNKNGFEYHLNENTGRNTPQVLGEKDGVLFEITEVVMGTNTESKIYSIIRIYNTSFGFDFRISKANFFDKVGNKMGLEDVQIGNEELDNLLVFKTSNDTKLIEFMNNDMIHKFIGIADQFKGAFENEDDQFQYAYLGELITSKQWKDFESMLAFTIELNQHEGS